MRSACGGRAGDAGSAAPDHLEAGKKRGRQRRQNRRPEVGSHQDGVVGGLLEAKRKKGFREGGVKYLSSGTQVVGSFDGSGFWPSGLKMGGEA